MKPTPLILTAMVLVTASLFGREALAARLEDLHARNVDEIRKQNGPIVGKLTAEARAGRYAQVLKLGADSSLTTIDTSSLNTVNYYRYQQLFRGIPVHGAVVLVSEELDGTLRSLGGELAQELARDIASTEAKVVPQQALAIAKRAALGGQKASASIEGEKTEKMVYIDDDGTAHLAYKVSLFVAHPSEPTEPTFFIDANTGQILKEWDGLERANASGPGGNEKTGQYEYGTTPGHGYLLVAQTSTTCKMDNGKSKTIDLNNGTNGSTPHSFTCPRNTVRVKNGAYSPLNDSHYFGGIVYDMFMAYVGVAPWTTKVTIRPHYGVDYALASYSPGFLSVNVGDGNATTRYPLAVLDVIAHEVAHGFTAQKSALSSAGEPAAIKEAFSDMAGEAAKYFMLGTNDFEFGKDAVRGAGAIRYMASPTSDGNSIDHVSNYVVGLDPHYAAGIYNKAFYLLATKPNWNTQKAFAVFALANRTQWSTTTTFSRGACGVELAANDLGYSKADVTAAFAVVGVDCGITWNPATLSKYGSAPPILSNSNRTIANGAEPPNGLYGFAAVGTVAKNSGKRYLEYKITKLRFPVVYPGSDTTEFTLQLAGAPNAEGDNDWGLRVIVWGLIPQDYYYRFGVRMPVNNGVTSCYPAIASWALHEGDTVGIAADLSAGKIWYSLNGAWTGNPSTGASPCFDQASYGPVQSLSGKTVLPRVMSEFQEFEVTIRGNAGDFTYPIPTAFVPWSNP